MKIKNFNIILIIIFVILSIGALYFNRSMIKEITPVSPPAPVEKETPVSEEPPPTYVIPSKAFPAVQDLTKAIESQKEQREALETRRAYIMDERLKKRAEKKRLLMERARAESKKHKEPPGEDHVKASVGPEDITRTEEEKAKMKSSGYETY